MKTAFKSRVLKRKLNQYMMHRYEMVVPMVNNDGEYVDYIDNVRAALMEAGFTGWTEYITNGYWNGTFEPGYTIMIYSESNRQGIDTIETLCNIGRNAMQDQEVIQVTVNSGLCTITEA